MPQTVILYYPGVVPLVRETEAVDVDREGTCQVQGVATVFFGNTFPCQASRLTLILSTGIGLILKESWTERMRGLWCL